MDYLLLGRIPPPLPRNRSPGVQYVIGYVQMVRYTHGSFGIVRA